MARAHRTRAIGKIRSWVSTAAAVALLPWIVYLAATLPEDYTAENWRGTWIGFDILLVAFLVATAVLGFVQSPLLTVVAFATGVLLVCGEGVDVHDGGDVGVEAKLLELADRSLLQAREVERRALRDVANAAAPRRERSAARRWCRARHAGAGHGAAAAPSAWSMSHRMSSMCSRPMDRRT